MIITILIIISMIVFGLFIHEEECDQLNKPSIIDKLARWWYFKMKSSKTNWMIWVSVVIVLYFLTRIIFIK